MSERADKKAAEAEQQPDPEAATTAAGEAEATPEADVGEATAAAGAVPDEEAATAGESEVTDPLVAERDALRGERDQLREKWLRTLAEMDNLRKRTRRDVLDARRFAQAESLRAFLDVHDDLERALRSTATADDTEGSGGIREGVELIFQKFQSLLKDQGVVAVEAQDAPFDPNIHEAVGQMTRDGVEPGMVIEVAQPGYRLDDMVLRPARVIISS